MSVAELMKLGGVEVNDNSHFIYTSGFHGSGYANLRPLKENPSILRELSLRLICAALHQMQPDDNDRIVVVGPETLGGLIAKEGVEEYNRRDPYRIWPLQHGVFIHDQDNHERFHWGKGGGSRLIQPDVKHPVAKVIWVDDLLNKASTWRRTCHFVTDLWPEAIEVIATIADRSTETPESLGVPALVSLRKLHIDSFEAGLCPMCVEGVPIVRRPGHGHEYEKDYPDYPGGYSDL
jgi:hypothetical protein